jgi:16S rRNA (guanine527-N7)-methyltransferase
MGEPLVPPWARGSASRPAKPGSGRVAVPHGRAEELSSRVCSTSGVLDRWLEAIVATPGLTAIRDREEARRVLLDDALRGVDLVSRFEGPIVDVGSGGGTPGIPLAASLPAREVILLEAERRKCDFLRRWEAELPNLRVVWGRAEEEPLDAYGVAVAKALARPPVAAEWCLPLVRPGGAAILWVGRSADSERVARVAERLSAELAEAPDGFLVLRKTGPTPAGFPRRPGMAKKRPLGD